MKKRSISIHGHATSVALEPEFWTQIDRAARAREQSVSALIRELDDTRLVERPEQGLASYIRVWVLTRALSEAGGKTRDELEGFHVDHAVDP